MALDPVLATHLANEARRGELRAKIAQMTGELNAASQLTQFIAGHGSDTKRMLTDAQAQLAALEQGAGPGVTSDFGCFSETDQLLRAERFAGKRAFVEYVKTHPDCGQPDAVGAYIDGVNARGKGMLISPGALMNAYAERLAQSRMIPDTTWESLRAWVLENE